MAERGHTYEDVFAAINARKPDFEAFIDPQKMHENVVIQMLPTEFVKEEKVGDILRVRFIQPDDILPGFDPVYLFDEGSTMSWIPCGRKLTCSYPGIKLAYGPDEYLGHSVPILEVDGQFDKLDEVIYIENHFSNTSTKYYGEMTELSLASGISRFK
jgi:phosphoribulokinase